MAVIGALEINRIFSEFGGDIVRVKVLSAGQKLIHFELPIDEFARAVMGTSAIHVKVISPAPPEKGSE